MKTARISSRTDEIVRWAAASPGTVQVACEAGPTEFGLERALLAAGMVCHVLAPSKMERPSAARVKTDLLPNYRTDSLVHACGGRRASLGSLFVTNDWDSRDLAGLLVPLLCELVKYLA